MIIWQNAEHEKPQQPSTIAEPTALEEPLEKPEGDEEAKEVPLEEEKPCQHEAVPAKESSTAGRGFGGGA